MKLFSEEFAKEQYENGNIGIAIGIVMISAGVWCIHKASLSIAAARLANLDLTDLAGNGVEVEEF